jgi:hypothetical protein
MVVTLSFAETCVGKNLAAPQLESGQIQFTTQASIGENYDASQYDASDYAVAARGAENVADGLRLNKSLASQSQLSEAGTIMAGSGGRVPFRDASRVAEQYGGSPGDWVKKTSSSYTARDGAKFETHWVENIQTGQRVEFKTKFPGGE